MLIDRRDLMKFGGAALVLGLPGLRLHAAPMPVRERLVVVLLRGAIDGLNVVVPYREAAYRQARPTIGLAGPGSDGGVLDLDGRFGLHPALKALMPLWQGRRLAFVQAAGSPDPTRSHFEAQHYMETAVPGDPTREDGWLNRLLADLPGDGAPVRGLSLGPVRPRILAGPAPSTNIALGAQAGRALPVDRPAVAAAFDRLYGSDDALGRSWRQGQAARHELLGDLDAETRIADAGAPPAAQFSQMAERLAGLMRQDDHIQVAVIELGGWDTHVNEGAATGQLAGHLAPLGNGLAAFTQSLGGLLDHTMILVMSEFGRTVHENGGRGTDHGHGTAMWVIGGPVSGGKVWGEWPGLDQAALYQARDLAVTTDYRSVIGLVLERHMRLKDRDLAAVIPSPQPVGKAISGLIGA